MPIRHHVRAVVRRARSLQQSMNALVAVIAPGAMIVLGAVIVLVVQALM